MVKSPPMSLHVLIAPDKFKGTLTAQAAAEAIAQGWRKARPADTLELLPMSDGGDGFGEIVSQLLHAEPQVTPTVDAAHRPCQASWGWEPRSKLAIIETAKIVGLAGLPPRKYHPFELDTFGLGAVLQAAAKKGARRCLVGIGGSATNDGGFGVARAMGWQFLDKHEEPIEKWTELKALARILPPPRVRWFEELLVAVDVQNPLLGPQGCTRVYGPQKGLVPKDFAPADQCLRRLAVAAERDLKRPCAAEAGAGAAGGLGFGLRCFLGARLQPGFDLFARHAELKRRLIAADLVITGEGAIDKSTLMGKGVGEIAYRCRQMNVPCLGLAGLVSDYKLILQRFTQAHSLAPKFTTAKQAQAKPVVWLAKLATQVAKTWPAV